MPIADFKSQIDSKFAIFYKKFSCATFFVIGFKGENSMKMREAGKAVKLVL
jgi:hypothetical protein